jgi:hypothetical protein
VVGHVRRIDEDFDAVQDLLEQRTAQADAFRNADEHERHFDGDLLAGDELLKVDVQDLLLERMTLDLANERARRAAGERELDDGAARGDRGEELLQLPRRERQRLRLTRVAVDDTGHAARGAQLTRDALAGLGARFGAE